MKKILLLSVFYLFIQTFSFSQLLEGDRMLELVGKPLSDPLYQQLRQQESFINNYIDRNSSVQIDYTYNENILKSVIFFNGWIGIGSGEKYGTWFKQLPFGLSWNLSVTDMENKLGKPVSESTYYGMRKNYFYNGWDITIEFSNNLPVKIGFENKLIYAKAIIKKDEPAKAVQTSIVQNTGIPVKIDAAANVEVNWPALRDLVLACNNLKPFAGKDSVDYFTEVYYSTMYKVIGFDRTAIKHKKKEQHWYYEAFLKTNADSNRVKKIFRALVDKLDSTIKSNSGNDFTLISVAKKAISDVPVTWIASWSLLGTTNKILPQGMGKVRITLLLVGMKDALNEGKIEYTLKFYIENINVKWDFLTWNKPL